MAVGKSGDCVDIGDVAVRVAEGFNVNRLGVRLNGRLDLGEVVYVHEARIYAVERQGVRQQVG